MVEPLLLPAAVTTMSYDPVSCPLFPLFELEHETVANRQAITKTLRRTEDDNLREGITIRNTQANRPAITPLGQAPDRDLLEEEELDVMVRVAWPLPVMEVGFNAQVPVANAGGTEHVRLTVPLKPPEGAIVTTATAVAPETVGLVAVTVNPAAVTARGAAVEAW
jgi:hypothetical protein